MLINVQAFDVPQSQQYRKFTRSKRTKYVPDGNRSDQPTYILDYTWPIRSQRTCHVHKYHGACSYQ